jgi:diacylglycerol kinase family enzyme
METAPHQPEPARPLGRVWLVANRASRSTDEGRIAALEAALQSAGATIDGSSNFPLEPAPAAADLAGIDTLVVMGGDGTLGAASAAAKGWDGQFLAIPGGTMNLLPKALHGDASLEALVALFSGRGLADAMVVSVNWLLNDWRAAASVTAFTAPELVVGRRRTVRCLFDGELRRLPPPVRFVPGWSDLRYIRTL